MINAETFKTESIPFRGLVIVALLTGLGVLVFLTGGPRPMLAVLTMALTEGGLLLLLTLSGACWGDLVAGRLFGKDAPGLLRFATSAGIGLWMWGTGMLLVGSLTTGLLTAWVWWPVVAAGFIIAAIRYRRSLDRLRFPDQVRSHAMVWVLLVVAAAIWLAGASRPPEPIAGGDTGQAARFLQLPREYFDAGHISTLDNNMFSYFPMNTEMLYLTMMCLRGDAYSGVYAAKLVHGLYLVLAAMALIGAFPNRKPRGYSAAVLVATTPLALVASWYARADLPAVLYMALAMLWLGRWLADRRWQSALLIGAALGAVGAGGYAAFPIVVGPTLGVMLILSLRKARLLTHVVLAAMLVAVLVSPWMVRSAITTGNPIFPLASQALGGPDTWSPECQQRWVASHGRLASPPVPQPEGWQQPETPNAIVRLYRGVLFNELFGPMTLALAGLAICLYVAGRDQNAWDTALIAIAFMQLAIWLWMGPNATGMSILALIVPVGLIVGGMAERLYPIQNNPFRPKQHIPDSPWGPMAAKMLVVLAMTVNLLIGLSAERNLQRMLGPTNGWPARAIAESQLGLYGLDANARLMLIGETRTFYFPAGAVYATAYNTHPLEAMLNEGLAPQAILTRLQEMGVTHIWVNWAAIYSLANSCGYPASLSEGVVANCRFDPETRQFVGEPRIAILEELTALGLTEVPLQLPPEAADVEPEEDDTDRLIPVAVYALPLPVAADAVE